MCVERVVVGLHGAYRELAEDLAAVEPRLRAERLRMLATIGLVMLRSHRSHQEPEVALAPERPQAPTEVPDELSDRKARLLARLQG